MGDFGSGLMVVALAGVTWWLTRNRHARPMVLWTRGWVFVFASAAILLVGDEAAWKESVVHLLGPFFPALALAGALAYAQRPVPLWLVPLAFVLAVLRYGLEQAGLRHLDHGISLAFEPAALLAAAFLAFRVSRRAAGQRAPHLLAPAFLALAVVEAANSLWGMRGAGLTTPHLVAWAFAGPFALAVQITVSGERARRWQRRVEQALGESEERFRTLTDTAFDLMAEMDRDGRFTYVNPRYEEWLGQPREALIGTRALDLVHPEDREPALAWFRSQSAPGDKPLLTTRTRYRDGGWRWVESSGGAYRAAGARRIVVNSRDVTRRMQLEAILRSAHDQLEVRVKERTAQLDSVVASLKKEIAERHRVEQELRLSEERWRNLSELSSDLSYAILVEPDGSLTLEWITQAVSRISGYTIDEINVIGWDSLLHPEDVERMVPHLSRVPEDETREVEGRIINRDGDVRWLKVRVTKAQSSVDGKLRVLGAVRDVTETKRGEKERKALLRDMGERVKELTCMYRVAESIRRHSDLDELFREVVEVIPPGWQYPKIARAKVRFEDSEVSTGRFDETEWKQSSAIMVGGEPQGAVEVYYLEQRPQLHEGPFLREERQLIDAIARALSEAIEWKRAAEALRRNEERLREIQKLESLGVLAGGIAHDFNNLLTVILGNQTLAMSEAQPGSRLAKQLDRIRSAAKHAEALTRQMLTYSGKASVSLKTFDLSELVEEMSELLEASTTKKYRLKISLRHGCTLVEGDPTQLRQVILNLVTNASESFQEGPGRVAVSTGLVRVDAAYLAGTLGGGDLAEGDYVYVEIADTGKGMDEEVRKRIFEPFFSTKFTGRGLGLASVLGIVRGHRGAIKLVTEPGVGTTFRVLLPVGTRTAYSMQSEARLQDAAAIRGGTILVVDDDAGVLELAREFLERSGFNVVTAEDGREALEILRRNAGDKIDAVVLDLTMPDLDGQEAFREIHVLRPRLPVILASGFSEEMAADRFPADQIAAFVSKPYEPEGLVDAVRSSLAV
jgi:PAS domain S-box-containing protein